MVKRIFDVSVSIIILLISFPIILVILLLIRLNLGSPVFFKQIRPGKDGVSFEMVKLRTMLNSKSKDGSLLPDSIRLTKFGAFLRSTSFDELPELWNVIKGDMSLVGPRPLLVEYLSLYSDEQARRHDVRPGITGWAQVNGRNAISWEEKFKLDVWYVNNRTFWLDIKILLLTVKKVFIREGINAEDHVTIEPFKGSKND